MATELKVAWGPRKDNVYLGKEITRLDGVEKVTGAAKYAADANPKGCLFAKVLAFKGGAGKVKSLDLSEALKVPGVKAVHAFVKEGDELQWDGAARRRRRCRTAGASRRRRASHQVLLRRDGALRR